MKQFDWEFAKEMHSVETYEYLKRVWNTPISEDDFVRDYAALPRTNRKKTSKRNGNGTREPGQVRRMYRLLRERFGFFK